MSRTAAGLAALAALAALAGTVLLAPAAHAAPVLTGKQRVTAASAVTVSASKVVKAYCPTGKVVIGGGAYVEGPEHVKLSMLRPVQDGHYLEAEARNPWGREPWSLVTLALCADPPPGLTYTSADSTPQAGVVRTAAAACPGATSRSPS